MMRTKVVYVLVSRVTDFYYEQLLLSIYSLKLHNPVCDIEVVTDYLTVDSLVGERSGLRESVDRITAVEVPEDFTSFQVSRYLKTKLRDCVSGDFLYIDIDTVICSDLSEVDSFPNDICAVRDKNRPMKLSKWSGFPYEMAKKALLADQLIGEPYFNGGLLYVKDTPLAHEFFNEWHKGWQSCLDKGLNIDQTSLCLANKRMGHIISPIDNRWNCQINSDGLLFTRSAKIIHYFNNKYPQYLLSRQSVLETIKGYGSIPPFVIDFINNPRQVFAEPWTLATVTLKRLLYPLYIVYRYAKGFIVK